LPNQLLDSGKGTEQSRKALENLRQLINTDGVALIGLDKRGIVREWNRGASRIFKYSAPQIVGHAVTHLAPPNHQVRLREILRKISKKRQLRMAERVLRLIGRCKDGSNVAVDLHIKPVQHRNQVYGFTIAATDISEAEARANELKAANEELAGSREELRASYEQLKESQHNLVRSEKLAFAARMAASVAHEIRNPLGIVTLSSEQLYRKLKGDREKQGLARAIQESTQRVNRLVSDFVNCTRPQRLKMRRRDIHKTLRKLVGFTKSNWRKHRISVILRFKEDIPPVFIDEARIEQAFLNIILNSIDAMPRGGCFTTTTDNDTTYVRIRFKDTGVGIAEENLFRVFDPFFTTKPVGTGLGLAVTYSIIASHNGLIDVESHKRRGAMFTICLPVERQKPAYVNELDLLGGRSRL